MNSRPYSALSQALIEHQNFVQRLALRLTRDPAEADDVVQDAWVRALERRPATDRGLGPWLASSLRGISRNRQRASQRRRFHESAAARPEASPVELLTLRQEVVEAVLALEEPYRRAVIMTYERGLSPREIAAKEGIEPGTVRTRLHRAHGKLRGKLGGGDQSDDRLAALAATPVSKWASKSVSMYAASGLGAAALVVSAAAGLGALRSGTDSTPMAELRGEPRRIVHADVPSQAMDPSAALAAPAPQREDASGSHGHGRVLVRPASFDSPYWNAVRRTRLSLPRFSVNESEASAHLRKRVTTHRLPAPPLPTASGLPTAIRKAASSLGVPVRMTEAAALICSGPLSFEWIVPPRHMTMGSWLSLVLALHATDAEGAHWEVRDGTLEIATLPELLAGATEFDHRLDDLTIAPESFFENGAVPHPIYADTPDLGDVLTALTHGMGEFESDEAVGTPVLFPPAIRWRHTPRHQLRVQAFLDELRWFRQPLPEKGVCGQRFRSAQSAEGARVFAAIAAAGGRAKLVSEGKGSLEERLLALGMRHRIGVLWTATARENSATPERLAVEVLHDTLLVKAADEAPRGPKSVLWIDLRRFLDHEAFSPDRIAADAHLSQLFEDGVELTRSAELVNHYVVRFVEAASWNENPRNSLRITGESQLIVHHDPWVLDEIERSVERLFGGL